MKKKILAGRIISVLIAATMVLSLVGCGESKSESARSSKSANVKLADYDMDEAPAAEEALCYEDYGYSGSSEVMEITEEQLAANENNGNGESEKLNDSARKLIKTYNLSVETEEFEQFNAFIQDKIEALNGYVQNMNEYNGSNWTGREENRYSYLTVRIPIEKVDEFLKLVGQKANVVSQNVNVEDVTMTYVDTETRKQSLEIEQKRLLELLAKAETVEDMITIEGRLSDVRYQIESLTSTLKTYDNLIEYTTVYLDINEVKEYTEPEPESFGEKIVRAFKAGWSGLVSFFKTALLFILMVFPILLFLAAVTVGVIFLIRFCIKRSRIKKAKKMEIEVEEKKDESTLE